jgi:hypothetical protein
MSHESERLRDRLLAHAAPAADRLDAYRTEVRTMLDKKRRVLERQRRISSTMWIFLVLLCTAFLLLGGMRGGEERLWFGILACFWFLFGAVFLLRYFLDRNRLEFLKEIKGLEVRILELTDRLDAR